MQCGFGNTRRLLQQLEGSRDELEMWNPALRRQVDTLVMKMKMKDVLDLVYRAEDHAEELSAEAQALERYCTVPLSPASSHLPT